MSPSRSNSLSIFRLVLTSANGWQWHFAICYNYKKPPRAWYYYETANVVGITKPCITITLVLCICDKYTHDHAMWTDAIFIWQFLFVCVDEKTGRFLCDKYISWKAGLLVFMWQIRVCACEKLPVKATRHIICCNDARKGATKQPCYCFCISLLSKIITGALNSLCHIYSIRYFCHIKMVP